MLLAVVLIGFLATIDLVLVVILLVTFTHFGEAVEHDIAVIEGELDRLFDYAGYYHAPEKLLLPSDPEDEVVDLADDENKRRN